MKLYAFSFNGVMLYATGNLSEEQIREVDTYLNDFAELNSHMPKMDWFSKVLQKIKNDVNIKLKVISVEHVFRCDIF